MSDTISFFPASNAASGPVKTMIRVLPSLGPFQRLENRRHVLGRLVIGRAVPRFVEMESLQRVPSR